MSMQTETLADRIRRCAELAGSGDELSRKTAIPRRTLESYLAGESEPKASRLIAIAESAGVSIEWLVTGRGHEQLPVQSQSSTPPVTVDGELLGLITEAVARLYKEEGAAPSPRDLGAVAGRLYGGVAAVGPDPRERSGALKFAIEQERQSLRAKANDPLKRKFSA